MDLDTKETSPKKGSYKVRPESLGAMIDVLNILKILFLRVLLDFSFDSGNNSNIQELLHHL